MAGNFTFFNFKVEDVGLVYAQPYTWNSTWINVTNNDYNFTAQWSGTNFTITSTEVPSSTNTTYYVIIAYNTTTERAFPNDLWNVTCTESSWAHSWNATTRNDTIWVVSDGNLTITYYAEISSGIFDPTASIGLGAIIAGGIFLTWYYRRKTKARTKSVP